MTELTSLITNSIIKMGFTAMALYFVYRYLGKYIELKQTQTKQKLFLERVKAIGEIQKDNINIDEAINRSKSISDFLESNLKIEMKK